MLVQAQIDCFDVATSDEPLIASFRDSGLIRRYAQPGSIGAVANSMIAAPRRTHMHGCMASLKSQLECVQSLFSHEQDNASLQPCTRPCKLVHVLVSLFVHLCIIQATQII